MSGGSGSLYFLNAAAQTGQFPLSLPVVPGWSWELSDAEHGYLKAPNGDKHCVFDLVAGTMAFEPGYEAFSAPGLDLSLVQESGETYAKSLVFTESEQAVFAEREKKMDDAQRAYAKQVYQSLTGVIQLERQHNGTFRAKVDVKRVKEILGEELPPVCSKEAGILLFNEMAEEYGVRPLSDPTGYMRACPNMYDQIYNEYLDQYEDMEQAIDNEIVDGTGYGIAAVLDRLPEIVRKNMREHCIPEGCKYSDLRYIPVTPEREKAARDFVKCRVGITLKYEKKRSYDASTLERANRKYEDAGRRLKEAMFGAHALEDVEGIRM